MVLSRTSLGLAVRTAREAAGLTLSDLSGLTDISLSSLSRTETGHRDLGFSEALAIAKALHISVDSLRTLAETFERAGAASAQRQMNEIAEGLNEIQRLAIEVAIEARAALSPETRAQRRGAA